MIPIYRSILKNGWQVLWRAKYLWFFGFFAAFVAGSGELNLGVNNISDLSGRDYLLSGLQENAFQNLWSNFLSLFVNFNLAVIFL